MTKDCAQAAVPWDELIPELLPGHRQRDPSYWRSQARRDSLYVRMKLCNELRNRIGHLEPIWKFGVLLEEARNRSGRRIAKVAGPAKTPQESLARLVLFFERLLELLEWLSPTVAGLYKQCPAHARCLALLTPAALEAYRRNQPF